MYFFSLSYRFCEINTFPKNFKLFPPPLLFFKLKKSVSKSTCKHHRKKNLPSNFQDKFFISSEEIFICFVCRFKDTKPSFNGFLNHLSSVKTPPENYLAEKKGKLPAHFKKKCL